MIFSLLRRRRTPSIDPLYGAIMADALHPALFSAGGVPDTFEGRFESAGLHVALVLRRLKQIGPDAGAAGQELVEVFFDSLDSAMREVGIGDMAVPKRMKKFAKGFYGRLQAYDEALQPDAGPMQLAEALGRNLLGGGEAGLALVLYVRSAAEGLARLPLADLLAGRTDFSAARSKGGLT